ncbi:MAG: protein translocase subunit SecF [Rickettsiales bacterium]|nr:protein translocase subunit SecF [Rickettsiales bacterium]
MKKYNFNFIKYSPIVAFISLSLVIASLFLAFTKGFNFGVDFSGGIVFEVRPEKEISIGEVRKIFEKESKKLPISEINIQEIVGSNDIMFRIGDKTNSDKQRIKLVETLKVKILENLGDKTEFRKVDYVGPQVGKELVRDGAIAIILSFIGISIYVWFRFEWQYGFGAIIALIHDAIMVLGAYSFLGLEFNLASVAAILTVVGYSINDSVVIYDRIRENLRKYRKLELSEIINNSLNETLSRTILTVSTVLVALLALILLGGDALFSFSFAIFFGVLVGTYSSIYVSAPILLLLKLKRQGD